MSITLDGSNGITTPMYNGTISANQVTPSVNMKNRIINGAMTINQRGFSGTPDTQYTLDRWFISNTGANKFTISQNAGSVTTPAGFPNYLGATSSSAYVVPSGELYLIRQYIEGFNTADLAWGTANAKTVTLSFQVYSSLTGTFGGSIQNSANDRSYPFSYTISSANTWTSISVTIAGDTSGTWIGATNGIGMRLNFSLGTGTTYSGTAGAWAGANYYSATGATSVVGTNGATFYITGVQLEVGSSATSFDYRPYGTELALCQRYYQRIQLGDAGGSACGLATGVVNTSTQALFPFVFPVPMRSGPSLVTTGTVSNYQILAGNNTSYTCTNINFGNASTSAMIVNGYVASGLTASNAAMLRDTTSSAAGFIAFNAEL